MIGQRVGPYEVTLGARRTLHLRFNDLEDPEPADRSDDVVGVAIPAAMAFLALNVWTGSPLLAVWLGSLALKAGRRR